MLIFRNRVVQVCKRHKLEHCLSRNEQHQLRDHASASRETKGEASTTDE